MTADLEITDALIVTAGRGSAAAPSPSGDGRITASPTPVRPRGRTMDATGLVALPGMVDRTSTSWSRVRPRARTSRTARPQRPPPE